MRKTALTMFGGLLRLVGLRGQWRHAISASKRNKKQREAVS